jgi:integrase
MSCFVAFVLFCSRLDGTRLGTEGNEGNKEYTKFLAQPVFGKLEKPRVGQRYRLPTAAETEAILARASPQFRLIYLAFRQCGARPGELCRATIADIDRTANAIVLREHKTARKTGMPRRIPIGRKLGELLAQAIGVRNSGPIFLAPAGKAWTVQNLSRTYSRLRDLAGLPRDLVLYLARHECGTKICREKGIEYARRLLGHVNVSTTQRYMHLDGRELADAQDLVE